jgi:hypothetical protein
LATPRSARPASRSNATTPRSSSGRSRPDRGS